MLAVDQLQSQRFVCAKQHPFLRHSYVSVTLGRWSVVGGLVVLTGAALVVLFAKGNASDDERQPKHR